MIPQADLEERLKKVFQTIGKGYEDEAVAAIARAGAGSVRDMLSLADTCVSYSGDKVTYEAVSAVLGKADFRTVTSLCSAILAGQVGEALERTEGVLSTGKNVGALLVDILGFLNDCAVVKTCRDAQNILAMPKETYDEILKIARTTDGHRLLRTTEIFVTLENDLRYSASPRVLLESAVLKASMPQIDYDIEALLARISALEKKLENGVTLTPAPMQSEMARVETKREEVVPAPPVVEVIEDEPPYFDDAPLMEEPPADFGGYYEEPTPKKVEPPIKKVEPVQAKPVVRQAALGDAKSVFGTFLRTLRKNSKNGVLFTICTDLDYLYEEGVFTLVTESDSIYRSLTKPDHYEIISNTFEMIGISQDGFAVRQRGKKSDDFNKNLEELKQKFAGVKIDVK